MEAAAQTLVSNFGQVVGEEFRQLRSVGGEVGELRDELATMNALLRMQSEAEDGAVDHFVREWMKQLRELSCDAEDCVDLYIFRIRCRPGDGLLLWSKRLLATLFPRHRLAGDIRALRARAVAISERHARYGVSREALRRTPSLSPATTPAVEASGLAPLRPANGAAAGFVGIRDQAVALAKRIKEVREDHKEHDMELKVFSIVGFGGLGKTTMAMELCRQLEADFERQAQVSVSQAFDGVDDLKGLLKRVIQQIVKAKTENEKGIKEEEEDSVGDIDRMDLGRLATALNNLLQDKRYLIVIDDVWTITAWDAILSKLPPTKCGSRIIVTTRIETVAKECSSEDNMHRMEPLNLEDSKKLFLSRAFGSMDASCPTELEVTMDNILKKCDGLPLAIISIAGLLASYRSSESTEMWEIVSKSIGSQMESNPTLEKMRKIVTLSYNHLLYHLKGCMMYLCIFPEDYEIDVKRLLYRWIAEGLVEEKRGLTLMEVAEGYLDELMSRSMIDPVMTSDISYNGRREACRVHDMMLEVMVSKSLEANFVSLVGGQYEGLSYDRIRRLSVHGISKPQDPEDSPSKKRTMGRARRGSSIGTMDVQHVRSLSMFDLQEQKLLDRLGEFTLLRVLDLEGCKGLRNRHLVYICRMYLLRFLNLRGTDISVIPKQIGDLEHLQMLDVRQTSLSGLPETVIKLEKIEHVKFAHKTEWYIHWSPPRGLRKMKALREVNYIKLTDAQVAQEIGELGQLREIGILFDDDQYHQSPETKQLLQQLVLSLSKTYSLRSLSICRHGPAELKSLNFLLELRSPPRLLRYLYLDGHIDRLPDWVGSLTYLIDIRMLWVGLVGEMLYGVLCKLPNLQNITLWNGSYTDNELVARTAHKFPKLRTLTSTCYDRCPKVVQFEERSMDKLEKLVVSFGGYKRSIEGVEHLPSLKEVQLSGKKDNSHLRDAMEYLKAANETRGKLMSDRFTVVVKYD